MLASFFIILGWKLRESIYFEPTKKLKKKWIAWLILEVVLFGI